MHFVIRDMIGFTTNFESGEQTINVDLLERLADLFGVDMSVFNRCTCHIKPLALTFRENKIHGEDLETISVINRIALNADFMEKLLRK